MAKIANPAALVQLSQELAKQRQAAARYRNIWHAIE